MDRRTLAGIHLQDTGREGKIDGALKRVDGGICGLCGFCKEDIGLGRLEVRPDTACGIACKTRMEAEEDRYEPG